MEIPLASGEDQTIHPSDGCSVASRFVGDREDNRFIRLNDRDWVAKQSGRNAPYVGHSDTVAASCKRTFPVTAPETAIAEVENFFDGADVSKRAVYGPSMPFR
jgi:hypothetical protein